MKCKLETKEDLLEYARIIKLVYENYNAVFSKLLDVTRNYNLSEEVTNLVFKN